MREINNEAQRKAPEYGTGIPAPTSIAGNGASSLVCAATEISDTDTTRTMKKKNTPLQMLTCAIFPPKNNTHSLSLSDTNTDF